MVEKRPRSARSPEPMPFRKVPRSDLGFAYVANPNFERTIDSNHSSRQSSVSRTHETEIGYGTPRSRSPPTRNGNGNNSPYHTNVQAIPKALRDFVLAVSKQGQFHEQLENVKADHQEMLPKCADFPALQNLKSNRLTQAERNVKMADSEAHHATSLLLDALNGHFPAQTHAHQDCISRADFSTLTEQLAQLRDETRELRDENRELKNRQEDLKGMTGRLENDTRAIDKDLHSAFDHMSKNEAASRSMEKDVDSIKSEQKRLKEQMNQDRLSFRDHCQTLGGQMSKVMSTEKAMEDLQRQIKTKAHSSPVPAPVSDLVLAEIKSKLANVEEENTRIETEIRPRLVLIESWVTRVDGENESKDMLAAEEMQGLESRIEKLSSNMQDLKSSHSKELEALGTERKSLESSLDTKMETLESTLNTKMESEREFLESSLNTKMEAERNSLESNFNTKMETLKSHTDTVLETTRNDFKRTSLLVENHVDLLQRHEFRLNSVTTEEMVRMMENQWRTIYGTPDQLRMWFGRLSKLEQQVKGREASRT